MLASLLPGLRDLRAPLAAGYLWLAAGWLYFAPRLPASVNDAHGMLKDIYRVVDASSPVAVGVGLTFVAYMVGMLSTGLLTAPVRGMVYSILTVIRAVVLLLPGLLLLLIGRVADRLFSFTEEDHYVTDRLSLWPDRIGRKFSRAPITRAEKLVTRKISDKVLNNPDYRKWILDHLEEWNLREFVRQARKRRIYTRYELVMDDAILDKDKRLIKIREILSEDLAPGADEYAEALVRSVADVNRHARDLLDELKLVPERIVGDKPATYERWDRLSAEGEFRQGVVPPLIAIIAVLMVRGVLDWLSGLLAAVLPLAILYQGIGKEYAAQAQLMQTIEADVIQIDLLERLTAHNLYWWNP
jgi:hypothetical protein